MITRTEFFIALFGAALVVLGAVNNSRAEPRICVETEALAGAYMLIASPWSQSRIENRAEVNAWLAIARRNPIARNAEADAVIFQTTGGSIVIVLLSLDGEVCARFNIPTQTHLRMLDEIAQTETQS